MRGCALFLGFWLTGGSLLGCGHGIPQGAALAVPVVGLAGASSPAEPLAIGLPQAMGHTPHGTIAPKIANAAIHVDEAATPTADADGDAVLAELPADSKLPTDSQVMIDPPATAPVVTDGKVPPLAADRGTPPAYPDAAAWASANLVLATQAAQYITPVLTPGAKAVVRDLEGLGVSSVDLWYGSHIQLLGDQGTYYGKWTGPASKASQRTSSHRSSAPQLQIQVGLRDNGILIGKTATGDTWVQFERHAFHATSASELGRLVGILKNLHSAHTEDFFIYRRTMQNVGPLGLSPHTDKAPLVIRTTVAP
jgi:hypothetical protein